MADAPRRSRLWLGAALAALIALTLTGAGVHAWRRSADGGTGQAVAATPSPEPPSPSPSVTPAPTVAPPPPLRLPNRDLRAGDHGPAVRILQRLLDRLRYDIGDLDGRFGDDTEHAVIAFQKVNGLARDGVVGPGTRAAFDDPVRRVPIHPHRRGFSIEVDLTRQVLYTVRDGILDRILDASTGGGYAFVTRGVHKVAITPTGEFAVYVQFPGWYRSSVGPMYQSSFFLRGFAVHGETEVPPYPASHGCVRVSLTAIDRIWRNIHLGTKVSIYRSGD